jgi:tetratricopeptide (TPR) repeat protein
MNRLVGPAKSLTLAVIALAGLLSATCSAAEPATARSLLLTGRFDEAAEQFAASSTKDPAAVVGLARCKVAVGKQADAEKVLTTALSWHPNSAVLPAELSILALRRGDYEGASQRVAATLALDKDCVAARYVQAELLKASGKLDEAKEAYTWLGSYYNRAPQIDDPQTLVFIGRGVAEHARWTRNSNQFRRLVSDVYPAALRQERVFWPAHLEAALLYLEKFNEPAAATEIAAGLAINSQAAELHAARAALALGSFDLATAKASIDRALEINPELSWAYRLRADWLFADVRPAEAIDVLEVARKLNPRDEATLGRLAAACSAVDGRPDGKHSPRVQALIDEVASRNPHCGEFFLAAGESFDRMRRFTQAAEFYRLAGERMPQLIATRGQLGLVLMRLGDEAAAARLLEESFAIDPFNVRVKNQLEVLDVLAGYAAIETDHFVIKFDRGQDELLAQYAARYLEEIFPALTRRLGFVPAGKTLIEIFSRHGNTAGHNWFSARMVGLPFIGTVGACAGKMVALSSPTELREKYNWATVLRHELVHVINLQQTDFNVPHWFTEGLAVHLEDEPRPRAWIALLAKRSQADTLFTLDDVTLGFVRPKSGDDWTLAYCQSELYIEHLVTKYGADAPGKMLAAFARHQTTAQAMQELFGVSQAEFEADYRRHLAAVLAAAGGSLANPKPSLLELQTRVAENPSDAEATAELARAWLDRDDKPQARKFALAAQKLKPNHPLAAYVLARLLLTIGDTESAEKLLKAALDHESPHEDVLALLAALKLQTGDSAAAQGLFELGDAKLPHSDRWVKGLVKIHLQSGDSAKLAPVLTRLAELEPENAAARKKLAQLALESKDYATAARLAWREVHTDVQSAVAHGTLAVALAGQTKHEEAVREFQVALRLDEKQADPLAGLAASLVALEKLDEAREAVARLRVLDANHSQLPALEKALAP